MRLRYAKRGRLRFTSHRDIARAFERAIRRAGIPMAYSSGFTAHPRVSWMGAAPTGAASESEYVELALSQVRDPGELARALDAALAPGIDVLEAVEVQPGSGKLADRIDCSRWELRLYGVSAPELHDAVGALLAAPSACVERLTKDGRRTIDVHAALVSAVTVDAENPGQDAGREVGGAVVEEVAAPDASVMCAILEVVVRQTTPVVRPDDVVAALSSVAGLPAPISSLVTRTAQGQLLEDGSIADPLAADRGLGVASASVALQER